MNQAAVRDTVLAWLSAHEKDMLRLLEDVVNIDSQSCDKAGVDKVGAVFRAHLERAGIAIQVFPLKNNGDCLLATIPGSENPVRILAPLMFCFSGIWIPYFRRRPPRKGRTGLKAGSPTGQGWRT